MKELLKINYEAEQPTVSARELYAGLGNWNKIYNMV